MIIEKQNTKKHENSPSCKVYEYPFNQNDINIAKAEISGRYPEKGSIINKIFKEFVFVIEGEGIVSIENEKFQIKKDDTVLVLSGKKYFLEGNFKALVTCSPAFKPKNHKIIE